MAPHYISLYLFTHSLAVHLAWFQCQNHLCTLCFLCPRQQPEMEQPISVCRHILNPAWTELCARATCTRCPPVPLVEGAPVSGGLDVCEAQGEQGCGMAGVSPD